MRPDHLRDLVPDLVRRVERRQRVLEDHRDAFARGRPAHLACSTPSSSLPSDLHRPFDLADSGNKPIAARTVTDLPEPLSPTTPSSSPAADGNVDAPNGLDIPLSVGNVTWRSLIFERLGVGHARFISALGSKASRSPSPTKLMHTIVITRKAHGKTTSHQ